MNDETKPVEAGIISDILAIKANTSGKKRKEKLAIVGSGLAGCLAALFAARVMDEETGERKYDVTLVEAKKGILDGASMLAAREHLWGEYASDPQTRKDCMWGSALWRLLMPKEITYTKQRPMRFGIAKKTHEDPIDPLTLESYCADYAKIKEEYPKLIDHIQQELLKQQTAGGKTTLHLDSDSKSIAESLFGLTEDLYRQLTPEELKVYQGNVQGGLQTQELGLNLPGYLVHLAKALENENVRIVTGCPVKNVNTLANGQQVITTSKGVLRNDHGKINFDQVIQASSENNFALGMGEQKEFECDVYRRAMAIVDIRGIDKKLLPPPSFILKGKHGGMFCQLTDDYAFVYAPEAAHLGTHVVKSDDPETWTLDDNWQKGLTLEEKSALITKFKKDLGDGPYAFLADLSNKKFDFRVRTTLNFEKSIDQRPHKSTHEIAPGRHVMFATKATLAIRSAIEAVEAVRARSEIRQKDLERVAMGGKKRKAEEVLPPFSPTVAIDRALSDPVYQVREALAAATGIPHVLVASSLPEWMRDLAPNTPPAGHMGSPIFAERTQRDRTFGQGFGGHKIAMDEENGPKTGPLFSPNEEENKEICLRVSAWILGGAKTPLTNHIKLESLARGMQNLLLHADTLELIDWMRDKNFHLSSENRELLFGKENLTRLGADTWQALRASHPFLPAYDVAAGMGLEKILDGNTFGDIRQEIMAALLPALFGVLDKDSQAKVTEGLALALHEVKRDKDFFGPLQEGDRNCLIARSGNAPLHTKQIHNNGRSIQVDFQPPPAGEPMSYSILFQGKEFYPAQFHFHRTRNLSPDRRRTEASVVNQKGQPEGKMEFEFAHRPAANDPDTVGELHAIFMHTDPKTGYKTGLALCSHIKLGEHNAEFDKYLAPLRHLAQPLEPNGAPYKPEKGKLPYQPLNCFNQGTFNKSKTLPEAAFSSLSLGNFRIQSGRAALDENANDVFYRGVYVVHLPDAESATISPEQLAVLQHAQPRLKPLEARLSINPIGRAR